MSTQTKPHVPHASNKWWGKRRYLNCAHPPVNSPEKSICPVCEYGTSDMQRDPLQAMCQCDCMTQHVADEQLRVSIDYRVDLGYGGMSISDPVEQKPHHNVIKRGVKMRSLAASLKTATDLCRFLSDEIMQHVYDYADEISHSQSNTALSSVDVESYEIIAGLQGAYRHLRWCDPSDSAQARSNQQERAVTRAMDYRLRQLISESNDTADAKGKSNLQEAEVMSLARGADGSKRLNARQIAELGDVSESKARRIMAKNAMCVA